MTRLRTVVLEDEPLARRMVCSLLEREPDFLVIGEAPDGPTGLRLIQTLRPDVAFIDVEMPELSGVEVARAAATAGRLAIVFVTAFSQFAVEAFGVEAVDYLVKPFSNARFGAALERVKQRVREQRLSSLAEQLVLDAAGLDVGGLEAGAGDHASDCLQSIPVHSGDQTRVLRVEQIVWFQADDYYTRVHLAETSHLVRISLTALVERLNPRSFLRVHRGAIINLDHVVAVDHLANGALRVVLSNGSHCPVSRANRPAVSALVLRKPL